VAGAQAGDVEPGQVAVALQARGVEVDAVRGPIGEALARSMSAMKAICSGMWSVARAQTVGGRMRRRSRSRWKARVEGRDVPGRAAGAPASLFHLVFAAVGIGGQVADVGDVDDVPHLDAVQLEHAAQRVAEQVGAQVADVGVVVDGRAAGVQAGAAGIQGVERAQAALVGVVQHQAHRGSRKDKGRRRRFSCGL
jgi:hypothetical protein